jgi:hypothetical protein
LSPLPHAHTPDFVPSCPLLNARVAALHARLPFDPFAQIKIDAHLLAAALRDDSPRLVMLPEDAPQLATLPDIGHLIRSCLVARRWTASYLHSLLHACIPCPRPSIAALPPDSASAPLLLNILLATLLGLYPQSVKQPPFPVRVALFRRVHAAITLDGPSQMALLTRIQPLLVLALTEYLCHILPRHMPSEYDALRAAFPVDPFFATAAFCVAALDAHPLVRYPCTDDIAVRRAEYAILLNSAALAEAAVVHSLVTVAPLPANITRLQEAALDALSQRCQRRARVRRTHYLCLLCERRGRKASPRLCSRTFRIVCRTCNDSPDSIVPIDTVGRIVTIRSRQLIFAPCCATVRDYTASGHDFAPGPCRHSLAPRTDRPLKPPRVRVACAMCDAPALPRGHDYLDHLPCRMTVCFLCQRHTPPDDWLRHVPNRRCFDAVCLEWDRKLRALHRRG